MNEAPFLTAAEIAHKVTDGSLAATAVIETTLERIARHDKVLNSFTAIAADRARARAASIDAARRAGQRVGPLAGVPFAVKNLIDIAGLPTVAGSRINRSHPPATRVTSWGLWQGPSCEFSVVKP
jgi:aspartyl-tRNA(Asn)/glutamyl-tRNA(Gln) amidotransferase subunit A